MSDARAVLEELLGARRERSPGRAAELLAADARYWDCVRGDVAGRDAVAAALTEDEARIELETLAAAGDDAVLELQVERAGGRRRSTEVYHLAGGAIASIRAYFDPEA
jgi:SnoaL-like domain